jgi:cytochrome c oxidase cbb3-type subunit 4
MTYEEAQFISQMLSMAIFASLLAGAFIYAFKGSNKKKFDRAAKAPLRNDDNFSER